MMKTEAKKQRRGRFGCAVKAILTAREMRNRENNWEQPVI